MSTASQTTLISPTNALHSMASASPEAGSGSQAHHASHAHAHSHSHAHPPPQRRSSTHSTHSSHHTHAAKRRTASHTHAGPSRRPSEGEQGRRALAAGLAMHAVNEAGPPHPRRKGSGDRPPARTSRSDTHLPRLSRTTSMTSQTSNHSDTALRSGKRPGKSRKRSGESVQVLSEDGNEVEAEVSDVEGEGWESGEGEIIMDKSSRKGKSRRTSGESTPMRRTKSDSHAAAEPNTAEDAVAVLPPPPEPHRQRTTGFPGAIQTPDPSVTPAVLDGHLYNNDTTHVMPAYQIKHQQSARSLHGLVAGSEETKPKPTTTTAGAAPVQRVRTPSGPARMRSTEGSGLPGQELAASPRSYPFPKMGSPEAVKPSPNPHPLRQASQPYPTPPISTSPDSPASARSLPDKGKDKDQAKDKDTEKRARLPSAPIMRHRPSNSSLRSLQSLRAPPHPLNSPTGYRTGILPASRPGSIASPSKEKRGPSMHHPPIAPPVINRETAKGTGWDIPEDDEALTTATTARQAPGDRETISKRRTSSSSTRSLQQALGRTVSSPSPSFVLAQQQHQHHPSRRQTALEAAAAASRLHTTTDPAVYHHSLGYSTSSAETAHLISRFLPPKKVDRPAWELDPRKVAASEGVVMGLTNGDYREAHESLVRMMRDMGVVRRGGRVVSTVIGMGGPGGQGGVDEGGLGSVRVKGGGGGVVKRGEWAGKTPFEMSVERCLAQRPIGM